MSLEPEPKMEKSHVFHFLLNRNLEKKIEKKIVSIKLKGEKRGDFFDGN